MEQFYELVQESSSTGLSWPDFDEGMVVIAQVDIVKMFEMGGHFLDIDRPAIDGFTGMKGIEQFNQVGLAAGPE